jgi:uncharacterized membrane protein
VGEAPGTRTGWSRRRRAAVLALACASFLSVGLVAVRVLATGSGDGLNLVWNLALAWVPLVAALVLHDAGRRGASRALLVAVGAVWLLFLPNAPYILTDYKFLWSWGGPAWLDFVVISAAAWTGLALGLVSLYLGHVLLRPLLGAVAAWTAVLGAVAASSFGIFLGRIGRWNSWDAFTQPAALVRHVGGLAADPLGDGRLVLVTVSFTLFLTAAYALFYLLAHPRLAGAEDARKL